MSKFVDVTDSINDCNHCNYGCNKTKCQFFDNKMTQNCARALNHYNDMPYAIICKDRKRTRPRKSRDRRLLEALLRALDVDDCRLDGKALCNRGRRIHYLSRRHTDELIAIKQAIEKKGGK